jgi:hypothetical protein
MNRLRQIAVSGSLVILSLVCTLLLLETLLHATPFRDIFLPPVEPVGYLTSDSEIGYDITPNFPNTTYRFRDGSFSVWSNELGCFDTPFEEEQSFVYVAGDSFTWGVSPFTDIWPKRVEILSGVRTVACGVGGHGTRQELIKTMRNLNRLPTPELIVLGYLGSNDVEDDYLFPNYTTYNGYRINNPKKCAGFGPISTDRPCSIPPSEKKLAQSIRMFIQTRSILYNAVERVVPVKNIMRSALIAVVPDELLRRSGVIHTKTTPFSEVSKDDEAHNAHIENVLGFKELADSKSVPLLVVLIPDKIMAGSTTTNPMWPNEKIKPYLTERNIPYIDLTPSFQKAFAGGKELYWQHDGHWNSDGNHLAGLLVTEYLLEKNFISSIRNSAMKKQIAETLSNEYAITY